MSPRPRLPDRRTLLEVIDRGGLRIGVGELRYQLKRRGLRLDDRQVAEMSDVIEGEERFRLTAAGEAELHPPAEPEPEPDGPAPRAPSRARPRPGRRS